MRRRRAKTTNNRSKLVEKSIEITEKPERVSKNRRKRIRQTDEKSLYIGIWAGIAMVVVFFILMVVPGEKTKRKRSSSQKKQQPDITQAKLMAKKGMQFLKKRNFRGAEKMLKQAKDILNQGLIYYKNDTKKQSQLQSLLMDVNENYHIAYKHSSIK